MKCTIIFDNETREKGLVSSWGFSCLVEVSGTTLLFDTGADTGILLANMETLSRSPESIDAVFISHGHWDHMGGLPGLLEQIRVPVFIPSATTPGCKGDFRVMDTRGMIMENLYSTGTLTGEDKIPEHALVVTRDKDVFVITGCAHPGVGQILDIASSFGKVRALIGGLHGFHDPDRLGTLEYICPTHCTRYKSEITSRFPEKSIPGGAGAVITL